MAPPLINHQKSSLRNELSEYDSSPSAQRLPLHKSTADQNAAQQKANADQNFLQNQKGTFEVAKRWMETIVFTKTPWRILSDEKYCMVEGAWIQAIESQDHRRALAGAPVATPSVCQLPGCPSLKIDHHTPEALSLRFSLILLNPICTID